MSRLVGWLGGRAREKTRICAGPSCSYDDGRLLVGWIGQADGTAIAASYRRHGPELLSELPGGVALALIDREREALLLALDRFGVHELSYCPIERGLAFASHVRELREHPDVRLEPDAQAIYDYVYFHMVPSPKSIYRGFQKLRPGHFLRLRHGAIEHGRYFTPSYEEHGTETEQALAEELRETLEGAVRRSVESSSGRVGAFLSGGVDSSTVAGLLGEITGEPARTYSIGFDVPGYDESRYAQIASRHFGTRHHDYTVTAGDVFEAAPKLAAAFDEPFGNASAIASYYCARLAKDDGMETLLGGDGGDEIFAGNARYAKQRLFDYYERVPEVLRTAVVDRLPVEKVRSYVRQARTPLPERLEGYNFLNRIPPGEIFSSDLLAAVTPEEPLELLRRIYREAPAESTLNRLLYLDLEITLAGNDLRKVYRTCEMAGVSVRYPFLDPDLVAFANRVPPGLKLKGSKLRYFFKRASEGFLPDAILTKTKHGFGVPVGRWLREHPPLRELAYDSLSSLAGRGYLKAAFADRLRALHQGNDGDYYGVLVWVLMMLELWHREHAA